MKYEEIALNEALELSDTELETIAGGQRHGWSEGNNDHGRRRRCHRRWNEGQGYSGFGYSGFGYGDLGYSGQGYSGFGYSGQDYDGDDYQRRCRRREE